MADRSESLAEQCNIEDYWLRLSFDQVSTGDLLTAITYVEANYAPLLSRWLIQYFHYRMEEGDFDVNPLLIMIRNVFSKLARDVRITGDQALGLAMRKGKYSRTYSEEHYIQATALALIELRKGKKWLVAVNDVAEMIPLSEASIAKASQVYRPFINHFEDEILRTLADEGPFEVKTPSGKQVSK